MLSPEYLTNVADPLLKVYEQIEDEILLDIAKKIKKNLDVSYEAEMWLYGGRDYNELKKKLSPYFKDIDTKLDLLVEDSIKKHYLDEQNIYSMIDKSLMSFAKNKAVLRQIELYQEAMKKQLHSIANTMGVAVNDKFVPLNQLYKHELNKAIVSTQSGVIDKTKAVRRVINNISRGGVKFINYENSGRNYTIESAVSMNVRSSLNRLSGEISLMNAKEMEHDLMETTAHLGARLSHSAWQGQVVSLSGENTKYLTLEDIGYGEVTGFMGANCKHNWYPFFEGLSSPYSSDYLEELQNKTIYYKGKEYSYYEATQIQRQMERDIRNIKKSLLMYNEIDDKEMFMINSAKRKIKKDEYENFCKLIKTPTRLENTQKMYYNKHISGKSVASNIKVKNNEILSDIMSKNWTDTYKRKVLKVYNDFEDKNLKVSDHFAVSYLKRANFPNFDREKLLNTMKDKVKFKEWNERKKEYNLIRYDEENFIRVVSNKDDSVYITFMIDKKNQVENKLKKGVWIKYDNE